MAIQNVYTLNHTQIADLVACVGTEVTVIVRGPTGSGKTTGFEKLTDRPEFSNHKVITVSCPNLDVGDVAVPMPNRDEGYTEMMINELFWPATQQPCIVILDEYDPAKVSPPVRKALLPLINERRAMMKALHPETIVCGTRNLQEEGIGADLEAHEANRVCEVEMRKPGNMEWLAWGINNGVHPAILGWVRDDAPPTDDDSARGQLFADFREVSDPDDNYYIHHPQALGRTAFVTPRSLERASKLLHRGLGAVDTRTLTAGLIGLIGDYGAKQLMAFVELAAELPTLEAIRKNPETAKVPTNAAATCMVVYKALTNIDSTWMDPWMTYMERLDPSAQGLFANGVRAEKFDRKAEIMGNQTFGKWCVKNQHMFAADKV